MISKGKVHARVLKDTSAKRLQAIINEKVAHGSIGVTNEFKVCQRLFPY